jgi:hypothetical protein
MIKIPRASAEGFFIFDLASGSGFHATEREMSDA